MDEVAFASLSSINYKCLLTENLCSSCTVERMKKRWLSRYIRLLRGQKNIYILMSSICPLVIGSNYGKLIKVFEDEEYESTIGFIKS